MIDIMLFLSHQRNNTLNFKRGSFMKTVQLNISNMTCGNCVKHVERALRALDGVQNVEVDLSTGKAFVRGDFIQGAEVMVLALQEAGYPSVISSETLS